MSLQSFTKEKNKSGSRESCIIPLPISISSTSSFTNTIITTLANRFPLLTYYTSNIQKSRVKARGSFNSTSNSVIVSEKQDIQKLWKQGFFGKGNLSRSEPTFEWRDGKKGDQPLSAEQITQNRRVARAKRKKNKKNVSASIINNEDSKGFIDVNDDKNDTESTCLIDTLGQPDDEDDNIIQNQSAFIQEHLQLTTEEAFFLSFGLGCLEIYDTNDNLMTIRDCWNAFRISTVSISSFPSIITSNTPQDSPLIQSDNPFIIRYVVYHYFRSLGWVVRGGMKFGCDYVLYEKGPVFKHAEFVSKYSMFHYSRLQTNLITKSFFGITRYCVIVLPYYLSATSNTNNNHFRHNVTASWQLMSNLSRSLVLCYVIIPPSPLKTIPDLPSHEQIQTLTYSDNDKNNY
ncbi:24436_t:CDS:2, partial [Racocetra persica]